jgi:hypothetical protein
MSTEKRVIFAWILLGISVIAWPITALTVFREEPQGILGLSWFAIILTCLDVVVTSDVRDKQK